ncbi:type II toxin-antitoxin system HicA family toxin [Nitrosomonas communis]|uniref:Predicted RNA binding protein YcfA, dsRBD-like fold, HicA-like mRNA interferase family n=1 Tax=Nitrosomonas communis TaxID=44574 RepID=A0A1I4LBE7_9PROT|nr:Predicted RNA binding protein YcfA, dsRBD-like fold, HicA-like mRNA interferase family [Nitrosomonas communis]
MPLILSGKQVCIILACVGFVEIHQRGCHIVMQKRLPGRTIAVTVPNPDGLRISTLQLTIRQSSILRSDPES